VPYWSPYVDLLQPIWVLRLSSTSCRYAAPLYVDIKKIVRTKLPEDEGGDWTEDVEEYPKVFIGEVGDPALQHIENKGPGCRMCVMSHAATFPNVMHGLPAGAHHAAVELLQPGGQVREGAGGSGGVPLRPGAVGMFLSLC
jgi:hypothetical protein